MLFAESSRQFSRQFRVVYALHFVPFFVPASTLKTRKRWVKMKMFPQTRLLLIQISEVFIPDNKAAHDPQPQWFTMAMENRSVLSERESIRPKRVAIIASNIRLVLPSFIVSLREIAPCCHQWQAAILIFFLRLKNKSKMEAALQSEIGNLSRFRTQSTTCWKRN